MIEVYRLKSVKAMKFVAPMPEQIVTTTMQFLRGVHQGNALFGSQFVLAWVQQISNFGSSDYRLYP